MLKQQRNSFDSVHVYLRQTMTAAAAAAAFWTMTISHFDCLLNIYLHCTQRERKGEKREQIDKYGGESEREDGTTQTSIAVKYFLANYCGYVTIFFMWQIKSLFGEYICNLAIYHDHPCL